jgi:radical SAM protein with 4Fe4S-binding SPASM domain
MNRTFEDLKNDLKFKTYVTALFLEKTIDYGKRNILEIELTNRCSIGCFYCGATTDTNPVFLDLDTVCNTIAHFKESRMSRSIIPHFSFTGGDPLEYPYFERLMFFLRNNKIGFSLKLNPSTLNESMYKMISEARCESVKLTFMGQVSQIKYRKKDTLKKLCDATRRFGADKIPVVWHFSLGEFNREDLLGSLGFVLGNRPTAVSIGRLARVGKLNEKNYSVDILPIAFKEFLKQILLFYYNHKRHGFNLVFKEKLWVPFLCEEQILSASDLLSPGKRLGCDAKERLWVLTYAGDLIGCGLLPESVLSRTGDGNFYDIVRSAPGRAGLSEDDPCLRCKYQEVCRGCRGVAGGSAGGKDPQCWL